MVLQIQDSMKHSLQVRGCPGLVGRALGKSWQRKHGRSLTRRAYSSQTHLQTPLGRMEPQRMDKFNR